MKTYEDGPAFPCHEIPHQSGGRFSCPGMSILDFFAAFAMEGCVEKMFSDKLLADFGSTEAVAEAIAKGSYQIAEAMLVERQRRQS